MNYWLRGVNGRGTPLSASVYVSPRCVHNIIAYTITVVFTKVSTDTVHVCPIFFADTDKYGHKYEHHKVIWTVKLTQIKKNKAKK